MSSAARIFKAPLQRVDPRRFEPFAWGLDSRRHKRHPIEMLCTVRRNPSDLIPCRTVNISAAGVALLSHIIPELGEELVVEIDYLGAIPARVTRVRPKSFAAEFITTGEQRLRIENTVSWLAREGAKVQDGRVHRRVVPNRREADLAVANRTYKVRIIDISRTGAGIETFLDLPIWTPVMLGSRFIGVVVRQFASGFGIEFADILPEDEVNESIDLRSPQALPAPV